MINNGSLEVFEFAQGSDEWHSKRLGIPTASNFSAVIAKGQGKTRRTYALKLASEIITGESEPSYSNHHMDRGSVMEEEARNMYAFQRDVDPILVGFMRRGRAGASPDALIGNDGLLEIKTKLGHIQLDLLDKDAVPTEHIAQIQGQLMISGRAWCDFVSYWPGLPLFVRRVERDDAYIAKLAEAIDEFNAEIDGFVDRFGK